MADAEAATPEVFEWHRVEGAVIGPLAIGAAILFLGPALGAVGVIAFKHDYVIQVTLLVIAGICVLTGPTIAIIRLVKTLRDDASLAARKDGVIFERNGKSLHILWDQIERVELELPTTLIFRLRDADPFILHEHFAMIETPELAKRLEELRRKASFGLL